MKEIIIVGTITVGVLLFLVGGALQLKVWLLNKRCLAAYSSYQAEWSFLSGCRVMWDGKLTPVSIIREIE